MARIFTTNFIFNQRSYDAIVTVIAKDRKMNFNVKVMDMELYDLIPDGKVEYEGKEGFKQIDFMKNQLSQSLMHSIASAIEQHLVSTI